MRIALTELENVRRDPSAYRKRYIAWKKQKRSPKSPAPRKQAAVSRATYGALLRSVFEFHRTDGKLEPARQYLRRICPPKVRRSKKSFDTLVKRLEQYADTFPIKGNRVIRRRDRLILALPKRFKDKLEVTGQIPRVDLSKAGYTVWLFTRKKSDWKRELRMPLIQSAYSVILNAELGEVRVGVYNFSDSSHQTYSFGRKQIQTAQRELIRLLGQVVP